MPFATAQRAAPGWMESDVAGPGPMRFRAGDGLAETEGFHVGQPKKG